MAVLLVAAVPLFVLAHQLNTGLVFLIVFIPFAGVGTLVANRQPSNPIGWLLLLLAFGVVLGSDAGAYAVRAYRIDHHALLFSRLAVALATGWIAFIVLPLPILLFPDGRVQGQIWRWTLRFYLALAAMFVVVIAIHDIPAFTERHIEVDSSGELLRFGPQKGAAAAIGAIALAVLALLSLSWVFRQLLRYRRSGGDEREQLKWLMSGGGVSVVGFLASILLQGGHSLVVRVIAEIGPFTIAALPLAIGVGILKYRLYEIDRLISRTISYALLTAMLAGVFTGIVVVLTDVLPLSSPVAVAASTLAAAALFNPLRLRTQRIIDRRFNRARYDAQETVAAFSGRLRDAIDLESITRELLHVVDHTVAPTHLSFWIRASEASSGAPRAPIGS